MHVDYEEGYSIVSIAGKRTYAKGVEVKIEIVVDTIEVKRKEIHRSEERRSRRDSLPQPGHPLLLSSRELVRMEMEMEETYKRKKPEEKGR